MEKKGLSVKSRCNQCGKEIVGDGFFGYKEWGYFSEKDLLNHSFCLCEACYDKMIASFVIPVAVSEKTEILNERNRPD